MCVVNESKSGCLRKLAATALRGRYYAGEDGLDDLRAPAGPHRGRDRVSLRDVCEAQSPDKTR